MPTKKQTISVRLDAAAKRRVEEAARLTKQSAGAFLESAGDERARWVLLDWALQRHRRGDASFSELASDTGLSVEEIMLAASASNDSRQEALDAFLASCRVVADIRGNPGFFKRGEDAVKTLRQAQEAPH